MVGMLFLSPAILAVVEMVKRTDKVPAPYLPFIAATLGAVIVPFLAEQNLVLEILAGILTGFSSVGLYEGAKQTTKVVQ